MFAIRAFFNLSPSISSHSLANAVRNLHRTNIFNQVNKANSEKQRNLRSTLYYITAAGVITAGFSYAAVPLYRMFCQAYSYGGTMSEGHDASKVESMKSVNHRPIKIKFNADIAASMRWNFKPQQHEITVMPGETALAFYTARNPTAVPVTGISTYNVVPFEAGQYFNKIQCFCFEEQQLNPHEQVDMPVFFYIDPEFADDPKMEFVEEITLSYTFFEAKDGIHLPVPSYVK
ncbi:cytochrome c oxidase assembly protein COX11, mitochondrial [Atheta coriaria]|uniref:cytochrome c oxidase assembly protein COX11, mitochondrial n=1 Tax=Dalotia coriaria TaxID=877792 RepID=UPI0031F4252D